jgi:hypothetical protein
VFICSPELAGVDPAAPPVKDVPGQGVELLDLEQAAPDAAGKAKPVMRAPALAELHKIFLGQAGGALELVAGKQYRCDTANDELRKDVP